MRSLNIEKLSKEVIAKRQKKNQSLRIAAEESGILHSSLHRIEQGKKPDAHTLIRVLDWLKMGLNKFLKEDK